PSDELELTIPAGIPRMLTIKLSALPSGIDRFEETGINLVEIYPNPASEKLNIEVRGDVKQKMQIRIFDVMGRQTLDQRLNTKHKRIDVSQWDAGVYFVWVLHGSRREVIKVLVNTQSK
ncbi:MAG TPA: T9SS type A sorting domain-containing protein, partial [Bacteroidales bacterium]|nr:T9SS type A sorting domain-containing protein [Bacteroidales bacterium]